MRALRWHGRRDVRLDEVDLEGELRPGMVEVDVHFCGICGSDLYEYSSGPFAIATSPHVLSGESVPITLGHEFSGTVRAVAPDVETVSVGDRVAADACWRCRTCHACVTGRYNHCRDGGAIGLVSDGGFADRVRFPAYCVVPLPAEVSDRHGALLEPLAVALHSLERGAAEPGDSVVVQGFGPIGAAVAQVGRAIGLEVLIIERQEGRRRLAEGMGYESIEFVDSARDLSRSVRHRTGGGVRLVIDATGATSAVEVAIEMTRRGGRVVMAGLPKEPLAIDGSRMVLFERSLIGSLGYANDLPRVAALIAAGKLDPEPLVTRLVPLENADEEFARLSENQGDDLKVLVDIRGSR